MFRHAKILGILLLTVGSASSAWGTDWRDGVMEDTTRVLIRVEDFGDLLWPAKACPVHSQLVFFHGELSDFFYGVSEQWTYNRSRAEFRLVCHSLSELTAAVTEECIAVAKSPLKEGWNEVVLAYRRLHSWFRCGG